MVIWEGDQIFWTALAGQLASPAGGCNRTGQEGKQGPRAGRSDPVLRNGLASQVFRGRPGWDFAGGEVET